MSRDRITEARLQAVVDRINRIMGTPERAYKRDEATGQVEAQIGCYHLSMAYGGYSLCQMGSAGGGTRDVLQTGHVSKRALYDAMFAYIAGIEDAEKRTAR